MWPTKSICSLYESQLWLPLYSWAIVEPKWAVSIMWLQQDVSEPAIWVAAFATFRFQRPHNQNHVIMQIMFKLKNIKTRHLSDLLFICGSHSYSRFGVNHLCDGLDWSSIFNQQLHHLHAVLLTGYVQRGETILCRKCNELWTQIVKKNGQVHKPWCFRLYQLHFHMWMFSL